MPDASSHDLCFSVKIEKKCRILKLLYINSTVKCLMAVTGNFLGTDC